MRQDELLYTGSYFTKKRAIVEFFKTGNKDLSLPTQLDYLKFIKPIKVREKSQNQVKGSWIRMKKILQLSSNTHFGIIKR